jgi:SprB repeat
MHRSLLVVVLTVIFSACSSDDDPVDCATSGPVMSLDGVNDAASCSSNDGTIRVSVSGGKEPYSFFVNNQAVGNSPEINNLQAGSYSVLVSDANHCSSSLDNVTIKSQDFSFTTTIQPNTNCLVGNGSITVDIEGPNPPYNFRLGNGNLTSDNFFSALQTGNHIITVQDNNNCTVTLSITIPQGTTGTSWSNDIKPIFEKNCAISGCHNGVSRSNNFREYASAKSFAKTIKSKTQDRSMPFDGSLTQDQIDLIACWVDDGALQN